MESAKMLKVSRIFLTREGEERFRDPLFFSFMQGRLAELLDAVENGEDALIALLNRERETVS